MNRTSLKTVLYIVSPDFDIKPTSAMEKKVKVHYKRFNVKFLAVTPYNDAAEFADKIGPDRLISISSTMAGVTVWYWK